MFIKIFQRNNMYTYLNTETNRELSKLLQEKGCVSESEKYYCSDVGEITHSKDCTSYVKATCGNHLPLFQFEDIIRPENAKKIFGDNEGVIEKDVRAFWYKHVWHYYVHELLDMHIHNENWQIFLINHLKGETNV